MLWSLLISCGCQLLSKRIICDGCDIQHHGLVNWLQFYIMEIQLRQHVSKQSNFNWSWSQFMGKLPIEEVIVYDKFAKNVFMIWEYELIVCRDSYFGNNLITQFVKFSVVKWLHKLQTFQCLSDPSYILKLDTNLATEWTVPSWHLIIGQRSCLELHNKCHHVYCSDSLLVLSVGKGNCWQW